MIYPVFVIAVLFVVILIVIFFVFISGFISTIVSDMKDVEGDKRNGVKTFPTVYGVNKTLAFLTAINSLGLFAIIIGWFFLNLRIYLVLLPIMCISRYYEFWLIKSGKKSAAYVYSKIDCPSETSIGFFALIGRLFVH